MRNCVSHPGIVSTGLRSSRAAEPSGAAGRTVAPGIEFVRGFALVDTPVNLFMVRTGLTAASLTGTSTTPGAGNQRVGSVRHPLVYIGP